MSSHFQLREIHICYKTWNLNRTYQGGNGSSFQFRLREIFFQYGQRKLDRKLFSIIKRKIPLNNNINIDVTNAPAIKVSFKHHFNDTFAYFICVNFLSEIYLV